LGAYAESLRKNSSQKDAIYNLNRAIEQLGAGGGFGGNMNDIFDMFGDIFGGGSGQGGGFGGFGGFGGGGQRRQAKGSNLRVKVKLTLAIKSPLVAASRSKTVMTVKSDSTHILYPFQLTNHIFGFFRG